MNIYETIHNESNPDELRRVIAYAKQRIADLAGETVNDLHPGETVKFSRSVRPTYLIGLPVEVVKVNRTTVTVKTPHEVRYRRFAGSLRLRVPLTMIER